MTSPNLTAGDGTAVRSGRTSAIRRVATETKSALKTTELYAYVAVLAAVLIAGLATSAGSGADDRFIAKDVWLYATLLTIGYMISRGLAKAGSYARPDDDDDRS